MSTAINLLAVSSCKTLYDTAGVNVGDHLYFTSAVECQGDARELDFFEKIIVHCHRTFILENLNQYNTLFASSARHDKNLEKNRDGSNSASELLITLKCQTSQ
jgi:hypothetical protein